MAWREEPPITGWQDLATDDPAKIPYLWTWEMWAAALLPKKASAQGRAARAERIAKVFATPIEKLTAAPFNPGILLGSDPATGEVLMAFDTDKKKGDHALVSREKLFAEEGLPRATYSQETTSGGFHDLYRFALREGLKIKNRTGEREWRPGVEVKGEGGLGLGAGAVLTGFDKQAKSYVIGEYRVAQDAPVAELSEDYADDLVTNIITLSAVDEKGEVRVAPNVEVDSPANQDRVIAFLQKWAPTSTEGEGGRAVMLFQVAHPCADRGCSLRRSAELMLDHWNGEKAFPPFDDDCVIAQVLSLASSRQESVGSKTAEAMFGGDNALSDEQIAGYVDKERERVEKEDGAKGEKTRAEPRSSEDPDAGLGGYDDGAGPGAASAVVGGIKKKVTTVEKLNSRFGLYSSPEGGDWVFVDRVASSVVSDAGLRRRLANEVVHTRGTDHEPVYSPAYDVLVGNAERRVYRKLVFTNKPTPEDAFNLYRGLGVDSSPGACDLILNHVREVICSGEADKATDMLKLMAWQIQNIGKPSRVITVLKSEEQQVGKTLLLSLLTRIYGPSGYQPGGLDQVTGRFNDCLRGRAYIFCDESCSRAIGAAPTR